MRKIFFLSALINAGHFLFSQIPNAGFEFWDNQPVPLQWETNSRPLTRPAWDPYIVRMDTERYVGNYAANFWANGNFKAYATTTFPVSNHPVSLSLFYKVSFPPCVNNHGFFQKDTVSVLVEILNGNAVADSGYWESISTSFNYSQLFIPISQSAALFDSCRITIWGGEIFGGCGIIAAPTEFKVDRLELQYPSACSDTGIVVQGLSCLHIDTGGGTLLLPCNVGLSSLGYSAGDTILFSFVPDPTCVSFCMEGDGITLNCVDTSSRRICNTTVSMTQDQPTSYVANNGSIRAVTMGAAVPLFFIWSNGLNGTGLDSIGDLGDGVYCVTVSDYNGCTATVCDSLHGPHICIDTALICAPGSLCCDAPLDDPVCGCDGVTYTNRCIAMLWHGVTSYTNGACPVDSGGDCQAGFSYSMQRDTVIFQDTSSAAVLSGYLWYFGDGDSSLVQNPTHIFSEDTTYIVCLHISGQDSAGNICTDVFCDTIHIIHNCIDSSLLCGFPICCDFAPMIPVCGCDSVTYINACTAAGFYGVTSYYVGPCIFTGVINNSETEKGIFITPIPVLKMLNLSYQLNHTGNTEIGLINVLGQKVKTIIRGPEYSGYYKVDIDIGDFTNGIYFVELKNEYERKLKMFVKE